MGRMPGGNGRPRARSARAAEQANRRAADRRVAIPAPTLNQAEYARKLPELRTLLRLPLYRETQSARPGLCRVRRTVRQVANIRPSKGKQGASAAARSAKSRP